MFSVSALYLASVPYFALGLRPRANTGHLSQIPGRILKTPGNIVYVLIIQNGRRQPFYEQNKKLSIDLKWREMRSVIQNGRRQPFCENLRSSKIGGGGGASQWSGKYTNSSYKVLSSSVYMYLAMN